VSCEINRLGSLVRKGLRFADGDHKRETIAVYVRSSYAKVCGCGLSLRPIGYSPALFVTYSAAAAAVAACDAI